jgi:hypothetical protein
MAPIRPTCLPVLLFLLLFFFSDISLPSGNVIPIVSKVNYLGSMMSRDSTDERTSRPGSQQLPGRSVH